MILIVDDSELFRLNVRDALEKNFDLDIVEADSIKSMQNFISGVNYSDISLIILDLNLPDGNGLTAISEIIEKNHGKQLPIIVVSKGINKAIIPLAKKCGVGDLVAKPINAEELIRTITRLYPAVFLASEKGNKPIEQYSSVINLELVKAQKNNYNLGLFVAEIRDKSSHYVAMEKDMKAIIGKGNKGNDNLVSKLKSSDMNQVFPITSKSCLVMAPYVRKDNADSIYSYFIETLVRAGKIEDENELIIAEAFFPEDGKYANDFIKELKQDLDRKRNETEYY